MDTSYGLSKDQVYRFNTAIAQVPGVPLASLFGPDTSLGTS